MEREDFPFTLFSVSFFSSLGNKPKGASNSMILDDVTTYAMPRFEGGFSVTARTTHSHC